MIRKTSKRRGTSVIAALIALCAVVGYGLTEWAPLDNEPQAVPSRQREERQTVREKVALEPIHSRNIIKMQIIDNQILFEVHSKSKSF